jgi:hypothetical protein
MDIAPTHKVRDSVAFRIRLSVLSKLTVTSKNVITHINGLHDSRVTPDVGESLVDRLIIKRCRTEFAKYPILPSPGKEFDTSDLSTVRLDIRTFWSVLDEIPSLKRSSQDGSRNDSSAAILAATPVGRY